MDVTEVLGLDLDDLSVRVALLEDTTRKAAEESATDCMQLQIQSLSRGWSAGGGVHEDADAGGGDRSAKDGGGGLPRC